MSLETHAPFYADMLLSLESAMKQRLLRDTSQRLHEEDTDLIPNCLESIIMSLLPYISVSQEPLLLDSRSFSKLPPSVRFAADLSSRLAASCRRDSGVSARNFNMSWLFDCTAN